jgi:hypothetical protein
LVTVAAGLEQEAPEQEKAQDDDEREDDDLNDTHSRFLTLESACPLHEAGILSARGAVCQRRTGLMIPALVWLFIKTVRENRRRSSVCARLVAAG